MNQTSRTLALSYNIMQRPYTKYPCQLSASSYLL